VVDRIQGQFKAAEDAELVEDVVEMVLDGLLGDEKFFANFLVACSRIDMRSATSDSSEVTVNESISYS
jgi:hypothetical protein